ncbi:mucin protein [Dickeya sp. CFBP 2040]|uniref:mucin protein n=1 Tax=Dickeya sp. CFBP 2040 TaxID=2718531 RepID=UPI001446BE19|nr:mucin protein [Dickeya sp. CFBP 2040]NKI75702.1 mucin protein [Dickeya sp. CFBP 2040]UUE09688.1 mucin protein [Dickeya zeae]
MTSISQTGAYAATPSMVISNPKVTFIKSEETGMNYVRVEGTRTASTNNQQDGEETVRRLMAHLEAQKAGTEPPQSARVTISEGEPTLTYADLFKKATSTDNPVTTTAGSVVYTPDNAYTPGTTIEIVPIQSTPVTTSSEADTSTTQPS